MDKHPIYISSFQLQIDLYMNSITYIVIKLLNVTKRVYNFNSNGSETKNSGIETSTLAHEHVSTFLTRRARNLADSFH